MNACKRRCRSLALSLKSKFIVGVLCCRAIELRQKGKSTLLNGFVLRITDGFEVAIDAAGLAGDAHAAAMPDQLVRELNPFFFGNDTYQVLLDFFGIFVLGEIEAAREANHMGVDHDAASDTVGRASTTLAVFRATPGRVR